MARIVRYCSKCRKCSWEGLGAADRVERGLLVVWVLVVCGAAIYGSWSDSGFDSLAKLWAVPVALVVVTFVAPALVRRRAVCPSCGAAGSLERVRDPQ